MAFTAHDMQRMGALLLDEGKITEALHYLREAEKELPHDYEVLLALGRAAMLLGDTGAAEPYFEECGRLHPERPEAYMEWAELLQRQGRDPDAKRMERLGRERGGKKRPPAAQTENWSPEATKARPGDFAFQCPACKEPIYHGGDTWNCPNCGQNLAPLRRGYVVPLTRLDGSQSCKCAQCARPIIGTEPNCPGCGMNLFTGDLPETVAEEPVGWLPFKLPRGFIGVLAGVLLLLIGVGQYRTPGRADEAKHVWRTVVARVTHKVEEGVPNNPLRGTDAEGHALGNGEMLGLFTQYFGVILVGGIIIAVGALKVYFDR